MTAALQIGHVPIELLHRALELLQGTLRPFHYVPEDPNIRSSPIIKQLIGHAFLVALRAPQTVLRTAESPMKSIDFKAAIVDRLRSRSTPQ